MPKNIIACSDGTGNTAIKGRGTNVFKLFEALDLRSYRVDANQIPQIAFYDDGVGTQEFKPLKIFAGATGFGLSRNVRQLYTQIVRVYDPGDHIYLFGFSRGAFTVRTLAGFISRCGLLDARKFKTEAELKKGVKQAYRAYRCCYRIRLAEMLLGPPKTDKPAEIKKKLGFESEVRVKFIGVWDTVDAVGLPFHLADIINTTIYRFKFPDNSLSPIVDRAFHALALNDERQSFSPVLWNESNDPRVEQVWFAGAHSNVGGGYPKQGMSLVALDWMMAAAEQHGLRFNGTDRKFYAEHANVDDKLYDPRSGMGIFYRWKIRDVDHISQSNGIARPKIHMSVLERIAHATEGYAPGNIPRPAGVVTTPRESSSLLRVRCEYVGEALAAAQQARTPLLQQVRGAIRAGLLSYYLYLACCTAVLIAAGVGSVHESDSAKTIFQSITGFVFGLITSPVETVITIAKQLWRSPALLTVLAAGFLTSYFLTLSAGARMSAVFSEFWHHFQPKLRDALKQARAKSKGHAAGA